MTEPALAPRAEPPAPASLAPAKVTVGELHREMRDGLRRAGIETADLDARLLLAEIAKISPAAAATAPECALVADTAARARAAVVRRIGGESVGRILGHRAFWTLDLALSPATLEPRPETETVVAAALEFVIGRFGADAPVKILDLGTGTGAILLALLSELPNATGAGVDLSPGAAATARANALRTGLAGRAAFAVGNFCDAFSGPFHVIVANPPYIRSGDLVHLPPEVLRDPALALDGGSDGLEAYRAILAGAVRVMRPDGRMFFEIDPALARPIERIAAATAAEGFWSVRETRRDLLGLERVMTLDLRK